jgi:arylsulfatase
MLLSGTDNHLAGLGMMAELPTTLQKGKPGYEGALSPNIVTFPELLQQAGYRTVMAGKWHLGLSEEQSPAARGFDRSLAMLQGGAHFFDQTGNAPGPDGKGKTRARYREDGKATDLPVTSDFYVTDFLTTKLIHYIGEGRTGDAQRKPFFAYAAYTAPHFPLQAPDALIEKYARTYEQGYEAIRRQRVKRLVRMGLLRSADQVAQWQAAWPKWEQLDAKQKQVEARRMAVYAAMVESVDRNIGRIVTYLKAIGEFDNTMFVFLSDNGAEGNDIYDLVSPQWVHENFDNRLENIGRRGSYVGYGPGWGQVSATPFKMFKGFATEGGVRSPAIISYPKAVGAGRVSTAMASVKDLAPTFLELAGVSKPPAEFRGRAVQAFQGRSMWPYLRGRAEQVHGTNDVLGIELFGRTMLRKGDWKLSWDNKPWGEGQWALYNLRLDPAEQRNLYRSNTEKVRELTADWNRWRADNNVLFEEGLADKFEYTNTTRYYRTLVGGVP